MKSNRRFAALMVLAFLIGCQNAEIEHVSLEPNAGNKAQSAESTALVAPAALQDSPSTTPELSENALSSDNAAPVPEYQPSVDELLLFFPTKYPDGNWKPNNLDFEDVWITSGDGTRIHGWYCPCKNPRAYVLYAHGNAGNLSHRSALMSRLQAQLRVSALIFDYRGYGRSDGMPTISSVIADARAASKFLAQRAGVNESELVLMGRSIGGAIAIQLASDTQPRGLIVESSFSSLKQVASHHYPKLAWLVSRKKLDSRTAIASYTGHLLQSHGTHDQTIPYESGVELYDAANDPKSFIKIQNADHNDSMPNSYYDALNNFFDDLPRQRE
jgi:alpha/beta superfamily hydrolase